MESTNYKTILDRTFMLLEQAISEKKAEQGAPEYKREFYNANKELLKKAGSPLPPKG